MVGDCDNSSHDRMCSAYPPSPPPSPREPPSAPPSPPPSPPPLLPEFCPEICSCCLAAEPLLPPPDVPPPPTPPFSSPPTCTTTATPRVPPPPPLEPPAPPPLSTDACIDNSYLLGPNRGFRSSIDISAPVDDVGPAFAHADYNEATQDTYARKFGVLYPPNPHESGRSP